MFTLIRPQSGRAKAKPIEHAQQKVKAGSSLSLNSVPIASDSGKQIPFLFQPLPAAWRAAL